MTLMNKELQAALEQLRSTQAELHQRNQELAIENQRRLVLDLTHIGWWDWDILSDQLTWSDHLFRLLGYAPGEVTPSIQIWRDRIHPDDVEWTSQALQQNLATQVFPELEYRVIHPDGSLHWLLVKEQGMYDASGQAVRRVGVVMEISDRKRAEADRNQAEAQLQLSQSKFEALMTNMPGMVYRYFPNTSDHPQHFSFVSHHCFQLLELSPKTLVQDANALINLIHPEDLPSFVSSVNNSAAHFLPWNWEGRIVTPSGQLKWIQGNSQAQKTPEGDAWDGLLIDISDRKLYQQKILEQSTLLDIASDAIFVRDLEQRILYWNRGAEQLYGWQAAEAIGQKTSELLHGSKSPIEEILQTLLSQNEWRGELHKVTKTGQEVIVAARWTLVRDQIGQPKSILSVNTDITQKKQLEAQFYRAQRLESLGTLASGIAHDLNNVLAPILTISQLLQAQSINPDGHSREMLKIVEECAERGTSMIKQILTFARGTGGERRPVEVVSLLQEVSSIIQQSFPKSIAIHQSIPPHARWLVAADPTYLHQVVMNLCINARDAMPNSGVLSLTVEPCFVDRAFNPTILDAQVGPHIVITVADTGSGIPPEVRDRIFDPFFTTKAPGHGTGLGLAIVLGIVKDYGGFLQVLSEVGYGTQVKVYLPMIQETPTSSGQSADRLGGNQELVLVVDDDVTIQHITQVLLSRHHYTVLSANDGMEAIALYTQHQDEIQAVILDIMMPGMSGITLIEKLREINPTVKIAAMSALPANRELAIAAGANAFLQKPYTLTSLLESLRALITA
ncbi:MAG: PAS domain-containing protein [Leptolyngbyaceae cyanobacterium SL_7_1]|nr:PAS domain-containing protein [Leptolyngbyaceae cyanobacterium SL_7_1]